MDTGKQSDEELLELLAQAQKARERAKQQGTTQVQWPPSSLVR